MKKLLYYWNESPWFFTIRFIVLFTLLYGGFQFFIGIAAPGGTIHSAFMEQYVNLVQYYTNLLVNSVIEAAKLFDISAYPFGLSGIRTLGKGGVNVGFDCLGIGVISIWLAYVVAHQLRTKSKLLWSIGGVLILYILNVARITLLVASVEFHWTDWKKLGLDHHTLYNIVSYIAMFFMAWIFVVTGVKAKDEAEIEIKDEAKG